MKRDNRMLRTLWRDLFEILEGVVDGATDGATITIQTFRYPGEYAVTYHTVTVNYVSGLHGFSVSSQDIDGAFTFDEFENAVRTGRWPGSQGEN